MQLSILVDNYKVCLYKWENPRNDYPGRELIDCVSQESINKERSMIGQLRPIRYLFLCLVRNYLHLTTKKDNKTSIINAKCVTKPDKIHLAPWWELLDSLATLTHSVSQNDLQPLNLPSTNCSSIYF